MSNAKEKTAPDPVETSEAESEAGQEEEARPSVQVERVGPCECLIRIEADAEYLRERYQEELASLQSEVSLPGFRRGRAPAGLVERRMGSTLRSDLISSVVAEAYDEAVEENELSVVAETEAPDLENYTWEPGQPAQFEFRCEVMPEVELKEKQYKGIEVEVPALEVTDQLLQDEMERFAQQFATWEGVSGTGIDWDDYVEAQVSVPEVEWSETIGFYPRAEKVGPFAVEGVKAALIGAKAGDEIELEAQVIEEEIGSREQLRPLAAQQVKVRLTLDQVTRRRVPEVDEELAKKIGLSSVEEIESLVRDRLAAALAERKEQVARDMVVAGVVGEVECELPPSLIERAAQRQQTRNLVRLLQAGVPRQEAERAALQNAGRTREGVEQRLRADFLLRKVAEQERILVTESEVDSQIRAFAARQGWREERARSYMEERGMVRALRDEIRERKTVDFLLEDAKVKEIPPDQFARRYASEEAPEAAPDGSGGGQ
ncbi:MAG: trigger factor [Planctomycetota bacterium]|jgi:trigger factor